MPDDLDALARGQPGHRAEHRQPVVAVGLDRAAAQPARPLDDEAVLGRLDPRRRARAGRRPRSRSGRSPSAAARRRRAPRSRPRRSSPAAPPAAARRSPAAPPRARPTVPTSGPWQTSSSQTGSSVGTPSAGSSSGPTTTPPMRRRMRKKPVRVQFAPMPSMTIRERGTSTAAAAWKAADDGSPGTCSAPSSSSSWAATVTRSPSRAIRTPAAASIRSVWSRLGWARRRWSARRPAARPAARTT